MKLRKMGTIYPNKKEDMEKLDNILCKELHTSIDGDKIYVLESDKR